MKALRNIIAVSFIYLICGGISYAAEYQEGVNYFRCTDNLVGVNYKDCRPQGVKTPAFKRVPFTNRVTGERTLENVLGSMYVLCDYNGCAVNLELPSSVIPIGTMMGNATSGKYAVETGWYVGYDANGHPTAYLYDRGPWFGEEPVGSEVSNRPPNYGTEVCYEDALKQMLHAFPNMTISQETVDEWRADCGLE